MKCDNEIIEVLPVGAEHLTKSSIKPPIPSTSAAESAAVCPKLAMIIKRWPNLAAHRRATILAIVNVSESR
jgi:hypothetical protein